MNVYFVSYAHYGFTTFVLSLDLVDPLYLLVHARSTSTDPGYLQWGTHFGKKDRLEVALSGYPDLGSKQ